MFVNQLFRNHTDSLSILVIENNFSKSVASPVTQQLEETPVQDHLVLCLAPDASLTEGLVAGS